MLRWLVRIIIGVIALVLLGAFAVQMTLWSDWPRRRIVRELQNETGLIFEVQRASVGWGGETVLHDVRVQLPFASEALASFAELTVKHAGVLPMLFGSDLEVRSIEVPSDAAGMNIVIDEAGEWNLRTLVTTVQSHRSSFAAPENRDITQLPRLRIEQAHVVVRDARGQSAALPPLTIEGGPLNDLVWGFSAEAMPLVRLQGRVNASGSLQHELKFDFRELNDLLKVFNIPLSEDDMAIKGEWKGRIEDGQLAGLLVFKEATAANISVDGAATLAIGGGEIQLTDPQFNFVAPHHPINIVSMNGGVIRFNALSRTMTLADVQLNVPQTRGVISGSVDELKQSAEFDIRWNGRLDPLQLDHDGALRASVHWPALGSKKIALAGQASGETPSGKGRTHLTLEASGSEWTAMQGSLHATELRLQDESNQVVLDGLKVRSAIHWPLIRLQSIALPNAQVQASGEVNAATNEWKANIHATQWTLPILRHGAEIAPAITLTLRAAGDDTHATVETVRLIQKESTIEASGTYAFDSSMPLHASLIASHRLDQGGSVEIHGELTGDADPLGVDLQGTLTARNIPIQGKAAFDTFQTPLHARVSKDLITFETAKAQVFGGSASSRGVYRTELNRIEIDVESRDITLAQVAPLVGIKAVGGTMHASGSVSIPLSAPQDIEIAQGSFTAAQVTTPFWGAEEFSHMTGRFALHNGRFEFADIDATRINDLGHQSKVTGAGRLNVEDARWELNLHATNWLLEVATTDDSKSSASITGPLHIAGEGTSGRFAVQSDIEGALRVADQDVGTFKLDSALRDRTMQIVKLDATLLGGEFSASGTVPLADWRNSRGTIEWNHLDWRALHAWAPALASLEGVSSGRGLIEPTNDPRALGPQRITVSMQSHDVHSRSVKVGDAHLVAYTNPHGVIIDDAKFKVADGGVNAWGRLSWHDKQPFVHATLSCERLELDQLVRWFETPTSGVAPGRISGEFAFGTYLHEPDRAFGEATVRVAESDLVNVPVFSLLHRALNLELGKIEPTGEGTARFRLEGRSVEMTRLEYYNRGSDMLAFLTVEDIWKGGESPINGVAFGAIRPLKSLNIPYFSDLDRALKAVQTGATSVRISGTLAQPQDRIVPFADVSGMFKRLLGGGN